MKDQVVKEARYFILYILLRVLFLRHLFWQIPSKTISRVISFTMFFVCSINKPYHIRALLATAPSVVQWIVRLVPCEIVTLDKLACGLICVRGKSISVALLGERCCTMVALDNYCCRPLSTFLKSKIFFSLKELPRLEFEEDFDFEKHFAFLI